MPKAKTDNIHYVNNRDFSTAVVEYVKEANKSKDKGEVPPVVTNYIAECFLKIAEGLSHKSNFVRYTYREEMVMDAVENCLRAINNYDVETATRTGKPNAFAYFTQISWYAFVRRINKEKKQQDIKMKYISEITNMDEFMVDPDEDAESARAVSAFVDILKSRIDSVKDKDQKFKSYKERNKPKPRNKGDSDISEFFVE
jgi:hypothetical protein